MLVPSISNGLYENKIIKLVIWASLPQLQNYHHHLTWTGSFIRVSPISGWRIKPLMTMGSVFSGTFTVISTRPIGLQMNWSFKHWEIKVLWRLCAVGSHSVLYNDQVKAKHNRNMLLIDMHNLHIKVCLILLPKTEIKIYHKPQYSATAIWLDCLSWHCLCLFSSEEVTWSTQTDISMQTII